MMTKKIKMSSSGTWPYCQNLDARQVKLVIVMSIMNCDFITELFPLPLDGLEKWSYPGCVTYRGLETQNNSGGGRGPFLLPEPHNKSHFGKRMFCFLAYCYAGVRRKIELFVAS